MWGRKGSPYHMCPQLVPAFKRTAKPQSPPEEDCTQQQEITGPEHGREPVRPGIQAEWVQAFLEVQRSGYILAPHVPTCVTLGTTSDGSRFITSKYRYRDAPHPMEQFEHKLAGPQKEKTRPPAPVGPRHHMWACGPHWTQGSQREGAGHSHVPPDTSFPA